MRIMDLDASDSDGREDERRAPSSGTSKGVLATRGRQYEYENPHQAGTWRPDTHLQHHTVLFASASTDNRDDA
jgi:hypothetical protein